MRFTVQVLNTPYVFTARPDESILQAALRQKIPLPWGCGGGICGVCMAQLIAGEMIYRGGPPLALFEEDAAAGKGLICCGYARSDLVLQVPEAELSQSVG